MNVMSRKATELSDKLDLSSAAKGQLKAIDGAAFRIDQIWQRKADNYLVRWILNSIIVAITVSLITTAVTALAAYPFSRMRFKGKIWYNGITTHSNVPSNHVHDRYLHVPFILLVSTFQDLD